jgi:hypothetical protein
MIKTSFFAKLPSFKLIMQEYLSGKHHNVLKKSF